MDIFFPEWEINLEESIGKKKTRVTLMQVNGIAHIETQGLFPIYGRPE